MAIQRLNSKKIKSRNPDGFSLRSFKAGARVAWVPWRLSAFRPAASGSLSLPLAVGSGGPSHLLDVGDRPKPEEPPLAVKGA